ncbi:hypothetical protein ACIQC7_28065 [Kitasatospora sp. NPDC088556]|uniref:hypothetical protein n=1 Tax=Kitasatospora sp. NPDC088556 TaxID=3364076 RepID=UPI00380BDE55
MSAVGGTPVAAEDRIERGLCTVCGREVAGRVLRALTPYMVEVEHCPPLDARQEKP